MVKKFALHITVYRELWVEGNDEVPSWLVTDGVEVILDEGDGEQQLAWQLDTCEAVPQF